MRPVSPNLLKKGRRSLSGFEKGVRGSEPASAQGFAARGAGLPFGQFPAQTSRADPNELAEGAVESLSGHIPRSSLRSSDLLPFYHQYPAACCGDFLLET
jgi:hypothetical protein